MDVNIKKYAVGGTAVAVVSLGIAWAISNGFKTQDEYDLENCETRPHTYACQRHYGLLKN